MADIGIIAPFISATLYNDFGDPAISNLTSNGGGSISIATETLGAFAEIGFGVNVAKIYADPNAAIREVNFSVRADFKFGNQISAAGITGQFRLQF